MRADGSLGLGALLLWATALTWAGAAAAAAPSDGPWFNTRNCKQLKKSYATSSGAHSRDDPGKITCDLKIFICGDVIERSQDVDKSQGCPASLNYKTVPVRVVCCDKWRNAQRPESQCNGMVDADCDGIANQDDEEPITPSPPKPATRAP